MAEGYAGDTPTNKSAAEGISISMLQTLCEEGKQMVKITKIHRENTELMFPDRDARSKFLDDYVSPPAPPNTYVTWSTTYLVEKGDED